VTDLNNDGDSDCVINRTARGRPTGPWHHRPGSLSQRSAYSSQDHARIFHQPYSPRATCGP